MSVPRFSVVIPTRNRPDVLRFSLQCALAQRFDDFEIVVSDNGTSDASRNVVSEFNDRRVRYVRTPTMLHMPDSWEFALSHASGRYVTFLSDDDGISPRLLELVDDAIRQSGLEIVAWPFGAVYHHLTSEEVGLRNTLVLENCDGVRREISSAAVLGDLSAARFTHQLPRLINSCASREVISDAKKRFGRVFFPSCPDYTVGVAQLAVRPALSYLSELVLVWGVCGDSIGYSASKGGAAAQVFFDELKRENADRAEYVPLQIKTPMNYALDSVLNMKGRAPEELRALEVDWRSYFMVVGRELLALEQNGLDIERGLSELREALAKQPLDTRLIVSARLLPFPRGAHLRRAATRARRHLSGLKRRIRGASQPAGREIFRGERHGFANMFEAAGRLDDLAGR